MLQEVPAAAMPLKSHDVRGFLELQAMARTLDVGNMVEYWKSAPYALNFMDDYIVKRQLVARYADPKFQEEIASQLRSTSSLCLPWEQIRQYQQFEPADARVRQLLDGTIGTKAWQILWIPPALPYYDLDGPYTEPALEQFTKRLVFSCWKLVPKALATLLSFAAESRMMRSFEVEPVNTPEARKKRRPLLTFAFSENRLTGMPVLGLIYPGLAWLNCLIRCTNFEREAQRALAQ